MNTKEVLAEYVNHLPPDRTMRVYGDGEVVHINVMDNGDIFASSQPKVGTCNRCGISAVRSLSKNYYAYCPEHDEDLTSFEINEPV